MSSGGSSPTVSIVSGTFTFTMSSSSSSASPSATRQPQQQSSNSSPSFYRNLFYILIGLLVAFGIVSFLSLLRARSRRNAIVREARRLGLMVPGIPGYVSMRERASMKWTKADGTQNPDWWEIDGKKRSADEEVQTAGEDNEDDSELRPLAIIPQLIEDTPQDAPLPHSDLPFFPNHLAYRPTAILPPPARFTHSTPETLDQLRGEEVDIITIIRMPMRDPQRDPEEGEEVLMEWGGVELGIARMEVVDRQWS